MQQNLFSIKKIPVQGLEISWEKTGEELGVNGEFPALAPVKVEGKIIARGNVYLFRGTVTTDLEVECARCLKKFKLPVKEEFNINYEPAMYESDSLHQETELGKEDFDVSYYENDLLPIGDDLREVILLAVPAVPLCADDCLGLCPQCGKDRNKVKCKCAMEKTDNPWQSLATLKKKLEEK